ncbi:MAG: NFACT family protein, partial [Candidatus Marsarchaeota archaeon]|nr:NFACT family protein [Candidatus Marsarchaeota archaeon]
MHEITALELGLAIKELQGKVIGSYLKKFYDLGDNSFRFSLHRPEGNVMLYCNLLSSLNETGFVEGAGAATNFAIAMRRRIDDSKITGLKQHGSDRVAIMELQSRGAKRRIVIEMFGKGNLILIDENDIVELCYRIMLYKDREVKPRARYVFPESLHRLLDGIGEGDIVNMLYGMAGSEGKLIVELSKRLNVGPVYLEDIITSAGLNPKESMKKEDLEPLMASVLKFVEKVRNPRPVVYVKDGKVVEYAVFRLRKYEGTGYEECSGISEMLDKAAVSAREARKGQPKADTSEIDAVIILL